MTLRLRDEEALLAAVEGDRERFYREELLPEKLRQYAAYLESRSAWTDVEVLYKTVLAVLFPGRRPGRIPGARSARRNHPRKRPETGKVLQKVGIFSNLCENQDMSPTAFGRGGKSAASLRGTVSSPFEKETAPGPFAGREEVTEDGAMRQPRMGVYPSRERRLRTVDVERG